MITEHPLVHACEMHQMPVMSCLTMSPTQKSELLLRLDPN